MKIDDKIRDERLQYDINRINIKIIIQKKINKYEYLTGEEITRSDQRGVIEQDTFTYSPIGKLFSYRKQIRTVEGQGEKQIKALE